MSVFNEIMKSLKVAGMLPLDAKSYYPTLSQLQSALGEFNAEAFKFYEGMKVYCVENKTEYRWEEVTQADTSGVIAQNFQYPANTLSNSIDYSLRYFNFVPVNSQSQSVLVGDPYIIFKGYRLVNGSYVKNTGGFLEIGDIVIGHFSATVYMTAKYLGGALNNPQSWAVIDSKNPTLVNTPGMI